MRENYGKLQVKNINREVYKIWLSRNVEPEFCEPVGWSWMHQTDPEQYLKRDLIMRILEKTELTENEEKVLIACILDNATMREMSIELNRTHARIQQILYKALRKLRNKQRLITGINPIDIDERIMSWFWWRLENAKANKKKTLETSRPYSACNPGRRHNSGAFA